MEQHKSIMLANLDSDSFKLSFELPWQLIAMITAFIAALGIMEVLFELIQNLTPSHVLLSFIISLFVFSYYCLWMADRQKSKREQIYHQYLLDYLKYNSLETLILSVKSPEFDKMNQESIIRFLNREYPGWSLGLRNEIGLKAISDF